MVYMYMGAMELRCAMANEQPTVQGVNGGVKQPCSRWSPEAEATTRRLCDVILLYAYLAKTSPLTKLYLVNYQSVANYR